jgi:phosphopantetheinyl transferase (holo-ACP synthase)
MITQTTRSNNEIYSLRFAAKEAIKKAYPERGCTLWDIKITSPPRKDGRSQAPVAVIKCELGTWEDGQVVPVSISHDGEYATATALGYDPSSLGGLGDSPTDVTPPRK